MEENKEELPDRASDEFPIADEEDIKDSAVMPLPKNFAYFSPNDKFSSIRTRKKIGASRWQSASPTQLPTSKHSRITYLIPTPAQRKAYPPITGKTPTEDSYTIDIQSIKHSQYLLSH